MKPGPIGAGEEKIPEKKHPKRKKKSYHQTKNAFDHVENIWRIVYIFTEKFVSSNRNMEN